MPLWSPSRPQPIEYYACLKRIYSQLYNSPWHCNTVKEDPTLFTGSAASDLLPTTSPLWPGKGRQC
eukprot:scaffold6706_cov119-Isochrysis_galbana.AAC.1